MADDGLSAALEEIRERGYKRDQNGAAAFRQSDNAARDVPRLLAALDAMLELHQPRQLYQMVTGAPAAPVCGHDAAYDGDAHFEGDFGYVYCEDTPTLKVCISCADGPDGDEWAEWPCPTHKAITSALLGEEAPS